MKKIENMGKRTPRPFVYLNMAMTIDGKVTTYARTPANFGSKTDKFHLLELRAQCDALMVGAHTAATDHMTLGIPNEKLQRQRLQRGLPPHPLRVIVTGRFSVDRRWEVFQHDFSPIVIFTSEAAPKKKRREFESLAHIYECGKRDVDLRKVMRILQRDWQVKRLLCEGGPTLNWELFRQRLVDEVNLTLCPKVFGGATTPTMVDGRGFLPDEAATMRLASVKRVGDELFLVYRMKR